jgi:hypothetical protein
MRIYTLANLYLLVPLKISRLDALNVYLSVFNIWYETKSSNSNFLRLKWLEL